MYIRRHSYCSDSFRFNLIDDLKRDPEKTYLLIAHNGISRIVESYFRDMSNEEFAACGIRNAEVKVYEF